MRKSGQSKGIFCIEGLWDTDLREPSSVRPILELLRLNCDIDYIRRDCATAMEFEFYLQKWTQAKYAAYPILYLASHGEEFGVLIGSDHYNLDQLASLLADKCENRIVLFASCCTLAADLRHLKRFLRKTGALAICGYRVDVDWLKATAFELLLLAEFQNYEFSGRGIESIKRQALEAARYFRELQFQILTQKAVD